MVQTDLLDLLPDQVQLTEGEAWWHGLLEFQPCCLFQKTVASLCVGNF
jgi:hypothetical protein